MKKYIIALTCLLLIGCTKKEGNSTTPTPAPVSTTDATSSEQPKDGTNIETKDVKTIYGEIAGVIGNELTIKLIDGEPLPIGPGFNGGRFNGQPVIIGENGGASPSLDNVRISPINEDGSISVQVSDDSAASRPGQGARRNSSGEGATQDMVGFFVAGSGEGGGPQGGNVGFFMGGGGGGVPPAGMTIKLDEGGEMPEGFSPENFSIDKLPESVRENLPEDFEERIKAGDMSVLDEAFKNVRGTRMPFSRNYTGEEIEFIIPVGVPIMTMSFGANGPEETELALTKVKAGQTINVTYKEDGKTIDKILIIG